MAFSFGSFDATAVDTNGGGGDFEPIPNGNYQAVITASELRSNKAGNGTLMALTWEIVGPTHVGRLIWD